MYALDACALIACIDKEEGWEKIEDLLQRAKSGTARVYINVINLLEVFYHCVRKLGDFNEAYELIRSVKASPVEVLPTMDEEMFCEAARLKAAYKISLADAIACATASCEGAALVTCDHSELEAVERNEHIPFFWIRPKAYAKKPR